IRYEPERAFHFLLIAPVAQAQALESAQMTMVRSFRKLSTAEADEIKPLRLDMVTVQRGDSVASLADRMAFEDYREDRFRMLNGLGPNDQLKAGDRVKIVVSD
ncbi:MAG: LysM peptidoglycan-binding domain-containing protein, partial [Sphingomonadales bacterium]